jgi:hypothetical protein
MAIEHIVGLVILLLLIGVGLSVLGGDGGGNGSNSSGGTAQNAASGTASTNRSGGSGGGGGGGGGGGSAGPSTSLDQSSNATATGSTQSTSGGSTATSSRDDDRTRIRTGDGDAGSSIELSVAGQSVIVRPGVAVGRELRRAMLDGGSTEMAARHVSREHIKFRYEDDQLYVTDAGSAGGTALGGQSISPGTWVAVSAGDSLTLADAVDVTITDA